MTESNSAISIMTLAEKHVQERMQHQAQELINKEIPEGIQVGRTLDAQKMLSKSLDITLVSEIAGIDINTLKQIQRWRT